MNPRLSPRECLTISSDFQLSLITHVLFKVSHYVIFPYLLFILWLQLPLLLVIVLQFHQNLICTLETPTIHLSLHLPLIISLYIVEFLHILFHWLPILDCLKVNIIVLFWSLFQYLSDQSFFFLFSVLITSLIYSIEHFLYPEPSAIFHSLSLDLLNDPSPIDVLKLDLLSLLIVDMIKNEVQSSLLFHLLFVLILSPSKFQFILYLLYLLLFQFA